MNDPTDNQKRAERIAQQNARSQERLEKRKIQLERRKEAESILQESSSKKDHALSIYTVQLEMAVAKQTRIQEQLQKDIDELEQKFSEKEDELENEREKKHKEIDERFDDKLSDIKKLYEERIKRLKDRLEQNENRPQVKNMQMIIENTKNQSSFKKQTVADITRELEEKDIEQALELVPEIRQNKVVETHKKENEKTRLEIEFDGCWQCSGCYGYITYECPTKTVVDVYKKHYCSSCAKNI
jgi:rubrerythrin